MSSSPEDRDRPPAPDRDTYVMTFLPENPVADLQAELKLLWEQATTLERGIRQRWGNSDTVCELRSHYEKRLHELCDEVQEILRKKAELKGQVGDLYDEVQEILRKKAELKGQLPSSNENHSTLLESAQTSSTAVPGSRHASQGSQQLGNNFMFSSSKGGGGGSSNQDDRGDVDMAEDDGGNKPQPPSQSAFSRPVQLQNTGSGQTKDRRGQETAHSPQDVDMGDVPYAPPTDQPPAPPAFPSAPAPPTTTSTTTSAAARRAEQRAEMRQTLPSRGSSNLSSGKSGSHRSSMASNPGYSLSGSVSYLGNAKGSKTRSGHASQSPSPLYPPRMAGARSKGGRTLMLGQGGKGPNLSPSAPRASRRTDTTAASAKRGIRSTSPLINKHPARQSLPNSNLLTGFPRPQAPEQIKSSRSDKHERPSSRQDASRAQQIGSHGSNQHTYSSSSPQDQVGESSLLAAPSPLTATSSVPSPAVGTFPAVASTSASGTIGASTALNVAAVGAAIRAPSYGPDRPSVTRLGASILPPQAPLGPRLSGPFGGTNNTMNRAKRLFHNGRAVSSQNSPLRAGSSGAATGNGNDFLFGAGGGFIGNSREGGHGSSSVASDPAPSTHVTNHATSLPSACSPAMPNSVVGRANQFFRHHRRSNSPRVAPHISPQTSTAPWPGLSSGSAQNNTGSGNQHQHHQGHSGHSSSSTVGATAQPASSVQLTAPAGIRSPRYFVTSGTSVGQSGTSGRDNMTSLLGELPTPCRAEPTNLGANIGIGMNIQAPPGSSSSSRTSPLAHGLSRRVHLGAGIGTAAFRGSGSPFANKQGSLQILGNSFQGSTSAGPTRFNSPLAGKGSGIGFSTRGFGSGGGKGGK